MVYNIRKNIVYPLAIAAAALTAGCSASAGVGGGVHGYVSIGGPYNNGNQATQVAPQTVSTKGPTRPRHKHEQKALEIKVVVPCPCVQDTGHPDGY